MSNRIKSDEIQIGNNFVLPIEQSNLTIQQAKVKKIMEETDLKAQQIIEGANNKSQVIVSTANTEAERIIAASRQKAQNDYQEISQQAYNEGFQKGLNDGLEKFKNDAAEALKSLDTLCSSNFDLKKNIIDSATYDIVHLISVIADKVCHVGFDDDVLYNITLDAIRELNDKESITIIVNPQLINNIASMEENFRDEIPQLQSLKIIEDNSVSPDGVIVETLDTRLDARVSTAIAEITRNMLLGADDGLE